MHLKHVKGLEMQNPDNKDPVQSSVYSTSNCDALAQPSSQLRSNQIADQDFSSNHSSGQSHQELSVSSEGTIQGKLVSAQSGNDNTYDKHVEAQMKASAFSSGTTEAAFPSPKFDYNPSPASIPYAYGDPYYGGVLAAYGPHAIIHPQMMGMVPSSRVPLPHEQAEEEPIYVNAKQYHAILRRRELRAKQEAQNKLIKGRKPYLHESRHIHAMKRARGVGGRFLNTKKLKQQTHSSENGITTGSTVTSTSSELSTVSNRGNNGGFHHQNHFGFPMTSSPSQWGTGKAVSSIVSR
ncbi:nuclear transcription factor Y subunit A-3-like isoform X2 [Asparagus officinalis]|uniref:nuclear transcription factor Y subunit A-3-like isoform X2 n=1 Tax=Asparagus officinalis TaxID=4686 RepID=UPI00098DE747|nr:nuclear transcription factor Y subunit A-3-like isoform X2 [Asparagus officinalis]